MISDPGRVITAEETQFLNEIDAYPSKDLPQILTVKQAAEIAQCHENTIYNRIRDGSLKAKKFGQNWRIRRSDLLALILPDVYGN